MTLSELGYCKNNGFGAVGLDFSEIKAYCEITSLTLNWWEVLTLKNLSLIYANEINAEDKNDFAPYQGEFKPKEFKDILGKFKR
ncbi:MAG: hypothetical protein LUC34_01230 [Campylobacter sp.]|nr:hypothetical protein [Campylobacter sp.]